MVAHITSLFPPYTQIAVTLNSASSTFNGPKVALFDVNSVVLAAFAEAQRLGINTTGSCITYNDPFDLLVSYFLGWNWPHHMRDTVLLLDSALYADILSS